MIRGNTKIKKISADLDTISMKIYIQGLVYCWCKNCNDDNGDNSWFAARDLVGGVNTDWNNTPIQELYNWHLYKSSNPSEMAAKDFGHLLKEVIHEDKRKFDTKVEHVRMYKWID